MGIHSHNAQSWKHSDCNINLHTENISHQPDDDHKTKQILQKEKYPHKLGEFDPSPRVVALSETVQAPRRPDDGRF